MTHAKEATVQRESGGNTAPHCTWVTDLRAAWAVGQTKDIAGKTAK